MNRVFTSVDFPRPDSPGGRKLGVFLRRGSARELTDNHNVEVEAFTNALTVPLVRQVREADITSKFAANNVPVVVEHRHNGSCGLGVRFKLWRFRCLRYWRRRTIRYLRAGGGPRWWRGGAGDTVGSCMKTRVSLRSQQQRQID